MSQKHGHRRHRTVEHPPTPNLALNSKTTATARHSLRGHMKDLAYIALTVVFFIASWLYVKGLERL